jgi:hypothetical protein
MEHLLQSFLQNTVRNGLLKECCHENAESLKWASRKEDPL